MLAIARNGSCILKTVLLKISSFQQISHDFIINSTILFVLFMNNVDLINVRNFAKKLRLTKGTTPTIKSTISNDKLEGMYKKKYTYEYAVCTTSNKKRIEELEKIQKRSMRIALQVKKQTLTWKLMKIVNGKSVSDKLDKLGIKMWHKYKRSPEYLLQH